MFEYFLIFLEHILQIYRKIRTLLDRNFKK